MRCEVIAVGTELLLGQIVDTNSAWIGEQLALAGIDSCFQVKVGDNLDRIVGAIRLALSRSDAVILCGGLGPTHDDITRDALAQVLGVRLVADAALAERIRGLFRARNREMPPSNLRQAEVPEGASVIPQMPGTAPGLICPVGAQVIYAVPGVPFEMREMIAGTVVPDLQRRSGSRAVIRSRVLRTWGQPESGLADLLAGRIAALEGAGNLTLAFLASGIEGIKVRITAKAETVAAAESLLAEEESRLREILGPLVFGVDEQTMEAVVLAALKGKGLTLGVAETLTGGLMSTRLSTAPGAESVFKGGVVVTDGSDGLRSWLNLPAGALASPDAVQALALGAARVTGATVGLAAAGSIETVAAGPPVGTVFLGISVNGETVSQRIRLPGRPEQMRQFTVIGLLNALRLRLLER